MTWIHCLFLAALSWTFHTICLKVLGNKLPAVFITLSFYIVATLSTGAIALTQNNAASVQILFSSKFLMWLIIGAGVTIALTDYFIVRGFSFGAPISLYVPLMETVQIILVALTGVLVFSETVTLQKCLGFALAIVGFFLMAR